MLRTARQRNVLCKECPVARVADLVGDSCSLLILRDLLKSPRRFGELQESLRGISSRTLTNKPKLLENKALVQKKESKYVLTRKGSALHGVVEEMRKYGKKYL